MIKDRDGNICGLGILGPDQYDSRDYKYADKLAGTSVDKSYEDFSLRKMIGSILNQQSTNSCTGHSAIYGMNVLLNRINGDEVQDWKINPWWVYYWARKQSNLEHLDGGAYMRDLMKALSKYGVYSNNMSSPESLPGDYSLDDVFTLQSYFRISSLNELKYALTVEKLPVFACTSIYNDAIDNYTGIVSYEGRHFNGYHAICLTGVKTIKGKQYIEFANSWGTLWGDDGFGYLHPDCIIDSRYVTDMYCPTYKYN